MLVEPRGIAVQIVRRPCIVVAKVDIWKSAPHLDTTSAASSSKMLLCPKAGALLCPGAGEAGGAAPGAVHPRVENVLHPQTGELAGERAGDDLRGDSDKTQKSEAHEASDVDPVCNTGSTAGITARWSRILVRPAKLGESVVISRGKCGRHSSQVVAVVKRPSKRWNTMTGTYKDVEEGAVCRR